MPLPLIKRWVIADPIPPQTNENLNSFSTSLRQILFNRGIHDAEQAQQFLDCSYETGNPDDLSGMNTAVERLLQAVDRQERIAVYGDFDVDGVTATVLMVEVLEAFGAQVQAYIPNRFDEGYGVNNDALDALAAGGVRLVITVDCGIRSVAEAEHAAGLGLELIISDHHHPGAQLPRAEAVICPKQPGDNYPDKELAGVGLAYKIAQALFKRRSIESRTAADWLDLVALGTVADIVPLVGENRVLVRAGLYQMRLGRRQGLLSLAQAAGLSVASLAAPDISFGLAPRLNAAGRLESALAAYNLLHSKDVNETGLLAQKLDDQNHERQRLTLDMQAQAESGIDSDGLKSIIMSFNPGFNPGVVGLVAAKLTEAYYLPSIVGTQIEEYTRASCRSIPEFHITHALDECSDLLVRHGGHALAAGFTVHNDHLGELISRLEEISRRELGDLDLRPALRADLEIPLSDLKPELLKDLDRLQPTGASNPDAAFVTRNVKVARWKTVGSEKKHIKLTLTDGHIYFEGIAFRQGHWAESMPEKIDILYNFERNVYNGRESLQLNIRDIHPGNSDF